MYQLTRLASWLWRRVSGRRRDGGAGSERSDDEESTPAAFSSLDASVNYAHGEPQNGVRELQRVSEQANELENARLDDR